MCASCSVMRKGRNNGKKLMAVRIVKHAFEIIHLLSDGANPIQVSLRFFVLFVACFLFSLVLLYLCIWWWW